MSYSLFFWIVFALLVHLCIKYDFNPLNHLAEIMTFALLLLSILLFHIVAYLCFEYGFIFLSFLIDTIYFTWEHLGYFGWLSALILGLLWYNARLAHHRLTQIAEDYDAKHKDDLQALQGQIEQRQWTYNSQLEEKEQQLQDARRESRKWAQDCSNEKNSIYSLRREHEDEKLKMGNQFADKCKDFNANITEKARILVQQRAQIEALKEDVEYQKELLKRQPMDFTKQYQAYIARVLALETEVADLRELLAQKNAEINKGWIVHQEAPAAKPVISGNGKKERGRMDSIAHSQMSKARKATRARKATYIAVPQSHDCCDHALCLQSGACPHTLCPYYLSEMQKRVWELEEALKSHACCDHSICEKIQQCAHTICPYVIKEVNKRVSALVAPKEHVCCDHSLCKEARQCTHDCCPFLQEEVRERMSVLEAWSAQKDKELSEAKNGAKKLDNKSAEKPEPEHPEPKKPEPEKPKPKQPGPETPSPGPKIKLKFSKGAVTAADNLRKS